jgi:3-deoxy-D-arabino-heptulosonate 7-phosphate (DAHP) synthase
MVHSPIIIAGPCAAESEELIDVTIREATKRKVDYVRTNLWKPRTKPGFDGLSDKGLSFLSKIAKSGLNPGLEVIIPEHVTMAIEATLPYLSDDGKLLVWIGARNQNHFIQREIAKLAAKENRVMLMVKNQPWHSEDHWQGILEHVLDAGLPKERLLNCYRGVAPHSGAHNPLGFRNICDFDLAMRVRETTGVPMIFDPSHTGGSVSNVLKISEDAAKYDFDGIIVEVHPDPANAITDKKQQITWPQFDELTANMRTTITV